MLHLIVLNKRTNDITRKNTDRNEFGPMRYCDTKKELVFQFGFLIVSDFSSNQMNEYLIRSSPNFDTGIRLDPTISAMKNSCKKYTSLARIFICKGEKAIRFVCETKDFLFV